MIKENYPKNFEEFIDRFQTEDDCFHYIFQIRWPDGFFCPRCQCAKAWKNNRNLLHCSNCGHQTSITAGTVFQDTRKPLRLWFHVMWWLVSQKTGASAKNLKDSFGFGSYKTTWTWLHKLRRVMIRPDRERLHGTVEVDETYIGGEEKRSRGRKIVKKTLVVVAVEEVEDKLGRVRFRCISDASEKNLIPFIQDNVEPGCEVKTDGWKGYASVKKKGYRHIIRKISGSGKKAVNLLPNVHLVVSLVKRWLMGTHQGAVRSGRLQYYLYEYAFRFNRRLSTHRGKLFYRLMQQSVITEAIPLEKIFATKSTNKPQDIVAT